jgi:uncharacterized protein YcfL
MRSLFLVLTVLAVSGCASSRFTRTSPDGSVTLVVLSKNLKADSLHVSWGEFELQAAGLQTDASTVIQAKSEAIKSGAQGVAEGASLFIKP